MLETKQTILNSGLLPAVGSLMLLVQDSRSTITLTWRAPFTLDISRIDPDIEGYCVDVISSTSSKTLHSECGITETEFTYPEPPGCDGYTFTVIPVNIVGNGTTSSRSFFPKVQCMNIFN